VATYSVGLPDGRTLDIEAPDEATALRGAKEWHGANSAQPSTTEDIAKSGGIGVAKGVIGLAGLAGDLSQLGATGLGKATKYIAGKLGYDAPEYDPSKDKLTPYVPGASAIQQGVEGVTGKFYEPKTTAGKYAETVGEFLPAAAAGPGSVTARVASAVAGGLGSELGGQLTKGTAYEPYARVAGALGGSLAPAVASRIAVPLRPSAERMATADLLRGEGIQPTAGQETGSKLVQALESPLGSNIEPQMQQVTEAAMRRLGGTETRATQDALQREGARIGGEFDRLSASNVIQADRHLGNDLVHTQHTYESLVPPTQRAPIIENTIREIGDAITANRGILQGDAYQALRSRLERLARGSSDPQATEALRGIRTALDDAMERSIAAINPNDLGAFREARRQYRNLLTVEKAAGGAGTEYGVFTPQALEQATKSTQGARNFVRGQGDFAEVAQAAGDMIKPLPNSGTPVRLAAQTVPGILGGAIGGLVGSPGGVAGSGMGAALGAIAGPVATHALVNNPVSQAYLAGRSGLQRSLMPALDNMAPGQRSVLNALIEAENQRRARH
jgi:hypothetical protein